MLLSITGIVIMVLVAADYLTDWNIYHPPFGIGLILTVIGAFWANKAKKY